MKREVKSKCADHVKSIESHVASRQKWQRCSSEKLKHCKLQRATDQNAGLLKYHRIPRRNRDEKGRVRKEMLEERT